MKAYRVVYERLPSVIEVPAEFAGARVEVILLTEQDGKGESTIPTNGETEAGRFDERGWPRGLLERSFGSMPDFPEIERPGPGSYEQREEFE